MTSVLLVYPFIRRSLDRSRFRFPPLGPAYVAASLRRAGHEVRLLDCTFLSREQARRLALAARADVVGIYCMATMREDAVWFARQLRGSCDLLVAGGPLPTCEPEAFLADFDVVVHGEGEQTMVDLLAARAAGADVGAVPGVVVSAADGGAAVAGPPRPFAADLDALPFPARDLLPNAAYISHGRRRYGYAVTTVMSSRGCPFACEFCSNVVFGSLYRERSPASVVDEIEEALALGYDRIAFSDDVFTMRPERVAAVCDEIERRGLIFDWECLARVDGVDRETAARMRRAGCRTVFFGIESGSDEVLRLMRKGITAAQARDAVWAAHDAGLEVGAFFILCYPGDTDETVLETLRFAGSLPLDYLGLSMPYPLPGTRLRERMEGRVTGESRPDGSLLLNQQLTYRGRLLRRQDALRDPRRQRAVRAAAAARALRPRRRPAHAGAGRSAVPAPALTAGRGRGHRRRPAQATTGCFAANAVIVSSTRRRSQASSISELKTKVTSFSCVQSRPSSLPPRRSHRLRARQRHRHVERDLRERQVESASAKVSSMSAAVSPGYPTMKKAATSMPAPLYTLTARSPCSTVICFRMRSSVAWLPDSRPR